MKIDIANRPPGVLLVTPDTLPNRMDAANLISADLTEDPSTNTVAPEQLINPEEDIYAVLDKDTIHPHVIVAGHIAVRDYGHLSPEGAQSCGLAITGRGLKSYGFESYFVREPCRGGLVGAALLEAALVLAEQKAQGQPSLLHARVSQKALRLFVEAGFTLNSAIAGIHPYSARPEPDPSLKKTTVGKVINYR